MNTPPPIPKKGDTFFTINETEALCKKLPSFLSRLMAIIQIIKYILDAKEEEMYDWVLYLPSLKVSQTEKPQFDEIMEATLSIPHNETISKLVEESDERRPSDHNHSNKKRHLMAVIAYMICFGSNPYLGEKFFNKVVISHDWIKSYYGIENRIFTFDPNQSNQPDTYYQEETIQRWNSELNKDLVDLLSKYFIDGDLHIIDQLIPTLFSLVSRITTKGIKATLRSSDGYTYLLSNGKYLLDSSCSIIGVAQQATRNNREDLFLKNLSGNVLEVVSASGKRTDISNNEYKLNEFPLRAGMSISIPRTTSREDAPKCWEVINIET